MNNSSFNDKQTRLKRGEPNSKGWVELIEVEEPPLNLENFKNYQPLLNLIQLSDLHLCDYASPARVEFLDRIADPHQPTSQFIPLVGTYRAQEILTLQTTESLIQAANSITSGIVSDREVDLTVITEIGRAHV